MKMEDFLVLEEGIDVTMDKVVKQIFLSCDRDNTNSVQVSVLINFLKPYMSANLNQLESLQVQLDPNNTNPYISDSFFYKVMHEWIRKLKEHIDNNNSYEVDQSDVPVQQSTPNAKIYHELVRSCSKILDSSHSSLYEYPSNNTTNDDKSVLLERLQDTEMQNQRLTIELDLVKQQLAVAEEQNESLVSEVKEITKSLQLEQQANKELRMNLDEFEKIKEIENLRSTKNKQMEKLVKTLEKEQSKLLTNIEQLEDVKFELNTKLELVQRRDNENSRNVLELKNIIDIKDSQIEDLMKEKNDLKYQLKEKNDLLVFYMQENDLIKQQNAETEKKYRNKCIEMDDSLIHNLDTGCNFNSPRFLNQLANPISNFDSPLMNIHLSSSLEHSRLQIESGDLSTQNQDSPQISFEESSNEMSSNKRFRMLSKSKSLLEELLEVSEPTKEQFEALLKKFDEVIEENENLLNEKLRLISAKDELDELCKKNSEIIQESQKWVINLCQKLDKCFLSLEIDNATTNQTLLDDINELSVLIDNIIVKKAETVHPLLAISGNLSERQQMKVDFVQEQVETNAHNAICLQLQEKIDKITTSSNIERDLLQSQIKKYESDKVEIFEKNQILQSEIAKLEKEIIAERNLNIKYSEQVVNLKKINDQNIENYREEINLRDKQQIELKQKYQIEIDCLKLSILQVKEENAHICMERDRIRSENEKLFIDTNTLRAIINGTTEINQQLAFRQQFYEQQLHENKLNEEHLRKQLVQYQCQLTKTETNLNKMEKDCKDLKLVLENIEQQSRLNNIELHRVILTLLQYFNQSTNDQEILESCQNMLKGIENVNNQELCLLDKEIKKLTDNIKMIIYLLHLILNRKVELFTEDKSLSLHSLSISDDTESLRNDVEMDLEGQNFKTLLREISMEWLEALQYQIRELDDLDLFVESFTCAEDIRNLSRDEMEQKFTTFALSLTLDISTSEKRYQNQQEIYSNQIDKYLDYLNKMINLILQCNSSEKKENLKAILDNLQSLKNITLDVVKSAEKCGLLHYEIRAANLWNFVVNYVAVLTKEDKKRMKKNKNNYSTTNIPQIDNINCCPKASSFWTKILNSSLFIALIFVLLLVSLFSYVHWKCRNESKIATCPFDWIFNGIIEKL